MKFDIILQLAEQDTSENAGDYGYFKNMFCQITINLKVAVKESSLQSQ